MSIVPQSHIKYSLSTGGSIPAQSIIAEEEPLSTLEQCIRIVKRLSPDERWPMFRSISHKLTQLANNSSPALSEQQQLDIIERLVTLREELKNSCGDDALLSKMNKTIRSCVGALNT